MSHLTTIKTQIKDRECLLKALRETLPDTQIAASEDTTTNDITNEAYYTRENTLCNVVAKKANKCKTETNFEFTTDIGFHFNPQTKTYLIMTDDYTPKALITKIKQNYIKATTENFAAKKGMKMTTKICPTTKKTIYTLTKQPITSRR